MFYKSRDKNNHLQLFHVFFSQLQFFFPYESEGNTFVE